MNRGPDALFLDFQTALAGRYSLERELGRGGMGIVYLAREVRLDRLVAIKVLRPELGAQGTARDRFAREARTAGRLSHPHIIPIHTVDEAAGFVFYVMGYVEGETLAERLRTRGAIKPEEAARILREVAWALAYAHQKGVVHRDVKPENILLEAGTGRVLVADFGIARVAEAGGGTGVGEILGTAAYMSPEQAAGETVDGRSDLYALGVVGFQMLAGRLPFEGDEPRVLLMCHLTQLAPPLLSVAPAVPPRLARVVDRCLAKDPPTRGESAEAVAQALAVAVEGRRDVPPPVRVFLKMGKLYAAVTGFIGALAIPLVAATVAVAVGTRGGAPFRFLAESVGGILASLALGPVGVLGQARGLLKRGYGPEDVAAACQVNRDRLREEAASRSAEGTGHQRRLWLSAGASMLAFLTSAAVLTRIPSGTLSGALAIVCLATAGVALVAVAAAEDRRLAQRRGASGWARLWHGSFGRWVFRVAGTGLPRTAGSGGTRRTELAVGSAVAVLFDALPKPLRRNLEDVPAVVGLLEDRARCMRERIADLDRLMAEAGKGPGSAARTVNRERDALLHDLAAARERGEGRLAEVVAAMERVRLALLRLSAGAGTPERVSADLVAAGAICEETARLLAAGDEVTPLLAPRTPMA